jgi:hypothetical protein
VLLVFWPTLVIPPNVREEFTSLESLFRWIWYWNIYLYFSEEYFRSDLLPPPITNIYRWANISRHILMLDTSMLEMIRGSTRFTNQPFLSSFLDSVICKHGISLLQLCIWIYYSGLKINSVYFWTSRVSSENEYYRTLGRPAFISYRADKIRVRSVALWEMFWKVWPISQPVSYLDIDNFQHENVHFQERKILLRFRFMLLSIS